MEIPDKWKRVGVALNLSQAHINAIDTQHRGDSLHCFAEVFHQWQRFHNPDQPVSWTTLVDVLQSRLVGDTRLAEKIKKEFI